MAMKKSKNPMGDMMPVLLMAGGAFAAYWYATNYGPTGAVMNAAGVQIAPSWWNTWFGTTTTTAAAGTTPTAAATQGTAAAPSVTITNATGASSTSFNVGDTVKVTVQGAANSPVTYSGSVNGTPFATQTLGTTDSTGNLVWSDTVPASLVGTITETWFVNGVQVGTITFTVSNPGVAGIGDMPMPSLRSKTGARIKRGYVN